MKRSSLERVTVGTTVQPKATAIPTDARLYHRGGEILARITRLLAQQKTDHAKLCALHAPDDECLAKGKAHHRYKFGVKVSVDTTNREELVLGMLAVPGNPYDGHTLAAGWAGRTHDWCCRADRGYRGHGLDHRRVFISGQRRGITPTIRRETAPTQCHRTDDRPHEERRSSRS